VNFRGRPQRRLAMRHRRLPNLFGGILGDSAPCHRRFKDLLEKHKTVVCCFGGHVLNFLGKVGLDVLRSERCKGSRPEDRQQVMVEEPAIGIERGRAHMRLGVGLKPLIGEFLKRDLTAAAQDREDAGPDLVEPLVEYGLGLLLVRTDRLPTLSAVRPVVVYRRGEDRYYFRGVMSDRFGSVFLHVRVIPKPNYFVVTGWLMPRIQVPKGAMQVWPSQRP
jgi:hypothetical protein